ncbi:MULTISPECIES: chromate efflux transporter [Staphylococcus]|uniref:chromate efflux transporter n=1 Tax=Staphylococcus TaxID=1279 RepID=UPI000D1B9764|nr:MULTISPECIES: chromate efflux transporter [Staphylococcus]NHM74279.1 chromate efflux transporter [Staphylococcus sp. 11007852]NJH83092.1 chromate efflux transporter [Staphylococcus agnetis]NJH85107.1 chromate efflux transporter [Staphylococcus agnetis]PTH41207.1 ChrA protein [Staphylococcus agnetis]
MKGYVHLFLIALRLGCTSFGGPTAHLGYFYDEYVKRRQWLTDAQYTHLVALCQFLPGPASSQVGFGIGVAKAGLIGGIISFLGFTLPSVLILVIFASLLQTSGMDMSWVNGLKIVAVAVVLNAILGMAQKLLPDMKTKLFALFTLVVTVLIAHPASQVLALTIVGLIGLFIFKHEQGETTQVRLFQIRRSVGISALILFFSLLIVLPIANALSESSWIAMIDHFYRSGALVFGGGHVVLPLLEGAFVGGKMISADDFITGYALAQAVPGPLFTFASYVGTVMSGGLGAIVATLAIFLPAFLLLVGVLPFWERVQNNAHMRKVLKGISAGVVGILVAAFYDPILTSAMHTRIDFVFAAILFVLLAYCKVPSWAIVILGIIGGVVLY